MNVILLNGPSSAGKTSLMKALQKILPEPYLSASLDDHIGMIPAPMNDYAGKLTPHEGFGWIREHDSSGQPISHLIPGTFGIKVYRLFKLHVRQMANEGFNVIVDNIALCIDDYDEWCEKLKGHQVIFVKVSAHSEILNQREAERGDRVPGVSRALQQTVHQNYKYHIAIDTSNQSADECAKIMIDQMFIASKGLQIEYNSLT